MDFNVRDKCWFIIGHGIAKGEILEKWRTWSHNGFPMTYIIKKQFSIFGSERYYVNEDEIFHTKNEAIAYIKKHFNCKNIINYSNPKVTYGR